MRGTWGRGWEARSLVLRGLVTAVGGKVRLSQGRAREQGRLHSLHCLLSQGGPQSSNYKYLLFVFPKSAHMEPSNRLNDSSVATREDGGA